MEVIVKEILGFVFKLKFVPEGYLTLIGGLGTLLIGAGNLICGYTGLCEATLPTETSLGMVTAGAGIIGLGRRKK